MLSKARLQKQYQRHRQDKRDLPVYDLPKPPGPLTISEPVIQDTPLKLKSDKECCVILPLFMAYPDIIPHYYIDSAFWVAHSWRVNTDCIEKGWDIWFLVDRKIWEMEEVKQKFEKANLTDFVLPFDVPEGPAIRIKVGTKLYAATVPYFQSYYRCYLMDTDMFVAIRNPKNILKTDRLLNIGADESLFLDFRHGIHKHKAPAPMQRIRRYDTEVEEEARTLWDRYVKEYLGAILIHNWYFTGAVYAWNPQQLRQDFKDMVIQLTPNISNDEDQVLLYFLKTGILPESLVNIWDIPLYLKKEHFLSDDPHYFDHLIYNSPEHYDDDEIKTILENSGLYRRL